VDMVGDPQALRAVPARAIEDEDDLLGRAGADSFREGSQLGLEKGDTHTRGQVKDRSARGGMDKADEIPPFVAMLHRGNGPFAVKTPHFVQNRFQADPVLVDRPELDAGPGEGGCDFPEERTELFLKVACSAASACTCRGRGLRRLRRLPSSRTRYAQPRYMLMGRPSFALIHSATVRPSQ
jgi:hypothetical protein